MKEEVEKLSETEMVNYFKERASSRHNGNEI